MLSLAVFLLSDEVVGLVEHLHEVFSLAIFPEFEVLGKLPRFNDSLLVVLALLRLSGGQLESFHLIYDFGELLLEVLDSVSDEQVHVVQVINTLLEISEARHKSLGPVDPLLGHYVLWHAFHILSAAALFDTHNAPILF